MSTRKKSVLEPFTEQIEQWFEADDLPAKTVQRKLRKLGCPINLNTLSSWWRRYRSRRQETEVLLRISDSTRQWKKYEKAFGKNPPPPVEHLLKLLRVLLLELNSKAESSPTTLRLVPGLMRPLLEWSRIEEERNQRQLAAAQRRQEREERKAVQLAAGKPGGLKPETLALLETEMHLL